VRKLSRKLTELFSLIFIRKTKRLVFDISREQKEYKSTKYDKQDEQGKAAFNKRFKVVLHAVLAINKNRACFLS
jgi:hypothetical protein